MRDYITAQLKKIEIDKWCEGFNLNRDPGNEYILHWILKNGAWFRQAWQISLCKSCASSGECGYTLADKCVKYKEKGFRNE